MNNCYLCSSSDFSLRKGLVRDIPGLAIVKCNNCGLVALSSFQHITSTFYESSGMHGDNPLSIESWMKDTKHDA